MKNRRNTVDEIVPLAARMRAMGITMGAATRAELESAGAEVVVVDTAAEVNRLILD